MRALVCQTQDICPIGTVGDALDAAGLERVTWQTGVEPPPATLDGFAAVVALGGAASPDDDLRYPWLAQQRQVLSEALERGLPTLGICLGAQLLSQVGGGEVGQMEHPEIGWIEVASTPDGCRDRLY